MRVKGDWEGKTYIICQDFTIDLHPQDSEKQKASLAISQIGNIPEEERQPDLKYLKQFLVGTGTNKNGHHFTTKVF